MADPLVLSIFPGIDLFGMAFEQEGFCIVRGPDLLWGGNIKSFHPPAGVFEGVIGGPPCQAFSRLRHIIAINRARAGDGRYQEAQNLIPEFERIVCEANPAWFLMENVPDAPHPDVADFIVKPFLLNNRWLGETQNRIRRFAFGTRDGRVLQVETVALESPIYDYAVCAAGGAGVPVAIGGSGKRKKNRLPKAGPHRSVAEMSRLQGLPEEFLSDSPLTMEGKRSVIGNGVPLPMGRAVAKAVKRAMYPESVQQGQGGR